MMNTATSETRLVPVDETAHRLGVSRATVYNMMQSGKLPSVLLGGRRMIPSPVLDAVLARLIERAS